MNFAAKAYIADKYLEYTRPLRPNPAKAKAIAALMDELGIERGEQLKEAVVAGGSITAVPTLTDREARYILHNFNAYAAIPSADGRNMAIAIKELMDFFRIERKPPY